MALIDWLATPPLNITADRVHRSSGWARSKDLLDAGIPAEDARAWARLLHPYEDPPTFAAGPSSRLTPVLVGLAQCFPTMTARSALGWAFVFAAEDADFPWTSNDKEALFEMVQAWDAHDMAEEGWLCVAAGILDEAPAQWRAGVLDEHRCRVLAALRGAELPTWGVPPSS